jgi:hypothetical protein
MEVPMRTILSALLATIVLLVSSIALTPSATAAIEYNQRLPLNDDFDSCTGEVVAVTGEQHIVGRITVDGAGQQHFGFHRNSHGTGVGDDSGAIYVLQDTVAKVDLIGTSEGGATVFVQFSELVMIRQGETAPDDDTHILMLSRYTITPDNTLTGSTEIVSVTCR